MNFKLGRFLSLSISFIIGSFFFISGAFATILPLSAHLQRMTTQFILQHTLILSLFGLGFALVGLSIVIYTFLKTRHRFVEIRTGKLSVVLDENIIHQYLTSYWEKQYPCAQIPFHLTLKKNSIQIITELPPLPFGEQKAFLEKIKLDFTDLFGRVLGYPHDVNLIATFQHDCSSGDFLS